MQVERWIQTVGGVIRGKAALLALSLGLALGFASGLIMHSNAETAHPNVDNANKEQSVSVPVNSRKTQAPQKLSELDAAINKLRASASNLSLPSSMFEPWWRTMQRDPDASWILRNFDIMSSDLDRSWAFPVGTGVYIPRLDTTEQNNQITITAEVPGIDHNNLDVTVTDDSVTIKGDKNDEIVQNSNKDKALRSIERSYGSFERTVALPCKVDSDKALATLKNGILTITVPKSRIAQSEGKKVTINRE